MNEWINLHAIFLSRAFIFDQNGTKCHLLSFDSLTVGVLAETDFSFDLYEKKGTKAFLHYSCCADAVIWQGIYFHMVWLVTYICSWFFMGVLYAKDTLSSTFISLYKCFSNVV